MESLRFLSNTPEEFRNQHQKPTNLVFAQYLIYKRLRYVSTKILGEYDMQKETVQMGFHRPGQPTAKMGVSP